MNKVLTALITFATIVAVAAMSGPADARWASGVHRGWSEYRGWGWGHAGGSHRAWGYPGWGCLARGYSGWRPRVIAVAGAIIGGSLAAGYFYPIGHSRYPSYYGPGIYGSGFCALTAYYGWAGDCY
jgi:hypothetical protein